MVWNKRIVIDGKEIEYTLQKRRGVRNVKLSVHQDGFISVTAPKWYPLYLVHKFIEEKAAWILEKLKDTKFSREKERKEYLFLKEEARKIIREKVDFFNKFYNFSYNRISVKNQRSCWGSCSEKRNLNFSYKIVKLPQELQDYVIVHELCHLKELNHSKNFWNLVSKQIPDYQIRRKELRKINI